MNRRFNLDDNLVQVRKAQNNSTNQKPKKPEPVVKPKKATDGKVKAGGNKRPVADGGDKSAKKKTKSI
jgi:hypothetical protein